MHASDFMVVQLIVFTVRIYVLKKVEVMSRLNMKKACSRKHLWILH